MKTGGMGGPWIAYDSPKPPAVADHYAYWGSPPPVPSERCAWWMRQIERGWRPNKYLRSEGFDTAAETYGVYVFEYLFVIGLALAEARLSMESSGVS